MIRGQAVAVLLSFLLGGCNSHSSAGAPSVASPSATVGSATAAGGEPEEGPAQGEEPGVEGDEPALPAPSRPPSGEVGAAGLVAEVKRQLAAVRSTSYTHHTFVDEARGEFDYDCSGFVGYALRASAPEAFDELRKATVGRPLARHFEAFFAGLPPGGTRGRWSQVARVADLAPGDIVAWLRAPDVSTKNTGHVMIVRAAPVPYAGRSDAFVVPITDSTHAPHGKDDPRKAARASGLGNAAIVLVTDPAGAPVGYQWTTWARSPEHRTPVALGRLAR